MRKQLAIAVITLITLLAPTHSFSWEGDVEGVATLKGIESLFGNILGVALRFMGLATFIMILVGGVQFLVSGGDPKATDAAKQTITNGIIGLLLVIASYLILSFIAFFTGLDTPDNSLLQFVVGIDP